MDDYKCARESPPSLVAEQFQLNAYSVIDENVLNTQEGKLKVVRTCNNQWGVWNVRNNMEA